MNNRLLAVSLFLGLSTMVHASEPKYAFPQSDKPVISKITVKNAPSNYDKYGDGEVLANGMWVKGNTGSHGKK